ncbi:aminotransferase class III-fold pyridoxal phosphate-dependent enzyme [Anaeromyxobacter oryzae]|uniref:Aspartate aminotransferase family protein n=1 Tax=Anaeromyxobacter oryzae TaxID=2918170 RepID=A0ABM7WSL7_9BACT|nr:aminotransferase class III-fold pyridoxal phosphate-dependent enzyme [Anaeromyxobacter oryzae]BDG02483.1 aspartate aminotransferase family protein [Anaeromyxobacter oryzae]
MTSETQKPLSGDELVALTKKHSLYEWSAQSKVDPIPVARSKGIHFWTPEGKRFVDFNSQLMSVNIGHGDERVVRAIQDQVAKLAYANPFMATEPRARLGAKLAEITPGDIDVFFFTNAGAEANENAVKLARQFTGRHKILARYRSYHGATAGAISLTGDPRRWAAEPGMAGVVHVLDPYHGIQRGWDDTATALANLEETIQLEGPQTIAGFILETVTGTNGILVPPDGYLQGVRDLCTKYGILMICDEVMAGFGRTGEWFAVDHWKVVPDLLTMAKGLTASYVPLGAVGMRRHIAEHFKDKVFYGGLTYNSHPVGCAAALATIGVYQEDRLIERARSTGAVMKQLLAQLAAKHPSVGAARSIGLFGLVELVRSRKTLEPMAPFNGTSEEMQALGRFFRQEGLYTMVRWNTFFTNPPLVITEAQLREAFEIIDRGLEITDRAVRD